MWKKEGNALVLILAHVHIHVLINKLVLVHILVPLNVGTCTHSRQYKHEIKIIKTGHLVEKNGTRVKVILWLDEDNWVSHIRFNRGGHKSAEVLKC